MFKKLLPISGFVSVFLFAPAGYADVACGSHEDITNRLEGGYKEMVQGIGLSNNGGLVELYVSEKGSWTFIFTRPNGMTCLVAAGKDWEDIKPILPNEIDEQI